MKRHIRIGAGLAALSLAACSGSSIQSSLEPPTKTTVNPITGSTLQFAVGTANIAGTIGLNTLVTLRQNTGSDIGTSVLSNAPTITGPAGFKVPAAPDAYGDAGTDHISAFIPTSLASPPPQTTFDPDSPAMVGGAPTSAEDNYLASSYGFFPGVDANSGEETSYEPGPMPFYSSENPDPTVNGTPIQYIGGPPAFTPPGHTSTQDGTFPAGYPGFTLGFADFQATPVAGTYTLSVVIPTGINTTTGVESYGTKTTTATLAGTVLPAWTTLPTFTPDGLGGGTITTGFAGGGTEEFIELVNVGVLDANGNQFGNACYTNVGEAPVYYPFKVAPGTATVAVPDDIGPAIPGKPQGHTFCTAADNTAAVGEDGWVVYGFAVDYPLAESAFPASDGKAAPVITTSGQDDITTSPIGGGPVAPAAAIRELKRLRSLRHHR